jgi:2-methylcitrate dehydratase PrpD
MITLTEQLATRLMQPVSPAARQRARLHLLDWLGCVAGARRTPVAGVAQGAEPDPLTIMALLGNVLEMDDVHRAAILHPGPAVWPAALSAARDGAAPMATLLDGAVCGYEAMIRVGSSFDAWHYARYHNTATAGPFGAVAAAVRVLGGDHDALVNGLGNAASLAGGLWQTRHEPGTMTKQLHVAHAALVGLWAARLACKGFTGPRAALEGPQGLYHAMTQVPRKDALTKAADWALFDVSFKPWAACRHAHPAIDAALGLVDDGGTVLVETYADALAFCDRPAPKSVIEAKFSLQHSVAVVLARGTPQLADFELDALEAPDLRAARARVQVVEAADLSARYPAHFGARVQQGDQRIERLDTLGDPERPLDQAGIIAKARALMAWGGVGDAAEAVIDACLTTPDHVPFRLPVELLP